jgi:predicted nucleotidyltransferase
MMISIVISSRFGSDWRSKRPRSSEEKIAPKEYTASDIKRLKMHSKARTPVSKLAKLTKRSAGSLRQKALKLGIGLGHQR